MTRYVVLDFETRSLANLPTTGGRVYAAHPSTELLCGVAVVLSDNSVDVHAWSPWPGPIAPRHGWWCPAPRAGAPFDTAHWHPVQLGQDDPPTAVLEALEQGAPLVAHNAHGFDRHVWEGLGLPAPVGGWRDALDRGRRRGLPGRLEAIGQSLYGQGKDNAGRKLMLRHSIPQRPRKPGAKPPGFLDPAGAALTAIIRYCARDALLLAAFWLDEDLDAEHVDDDVLAVHEAIDERGVPIDLELAARLAETEARLAAAAEKRAAAHGVGGTLLRAPPALRLWLAEHAGVELEDVTGQVVRQALARPDLPAVARDVLEARLTVARVTGGKLAALAARTDEDSRTRGTLAYWGAHTGRWSGRGPQPQNFPRPIDGFDAAAALEVLEAHGPEGLIRHLGAESARLSKPAGQLLGALLRSVVTAPSGRLLATVDFAQIEARALLHLADAQTALDVYRRGGDPYRVLAAEVFRVAEADVQRHQRQIAKVMTLALGYGGGVGALERYAAKVGVDLVAAGLTSAELVEAWRDAHPAVAGTRTGKVLERLDGSEAVMRRGGFWKALARAAKRAIDAGGTHEVAGTAWLMDGPHLVCVLPSGRPCVYREARIQELPSKWEAGKLRKAITYASPRGGRHSLYGGLLAENVTQAYCRDLLAEALVRLELAGLPVVLHVHDEVVCEVEWPDQLTEVRQIAEQRPPWAAGLPIATDGSVGRRWSK